MWQCVQLFCAECNAPCQGDLAFDKAKPPASAAKWQGNDQTDLQCQASRYCHHQVQELLVQPGIENLDLILKERRLQWYGHVECFNGAVKTAFDIQVDGKHGPGRPKMTWKLLTGRDCREWKLSAINPHDRHTWLDLVWDLPCLQQASYLQGGPLMWMLPLYLHVNQKSDYDDMLINMCICSVSK